MPGVRVVRLLGRFVAASETHQVRCHNPVPRFYKHRDHLSVQEAP